MTDQHHSIEVKDAIAKVEGAPRKSDGPVSRRDMLSFHGLAALLSRKLLEGGELAEEYLRSKVAQESNAAAKTAAEAAELSSRKEENEAKADLTRQQAVGSFVENLKNISELDPVAQTLAVAKLIVENPELNEQLERIDDILTKLRLTKGVIIQTANEKRIGEASDNESE